MTTPATNGRKSRPAPAPVSDAAEFQPEDFVYLGRSRSSTKGVPLANLRRINPKDGKPRDTISVYSWAPHWKQRLVGGLYRGAKFSEKQALGLDSVSFINEHGTAEDRWNWRASDQQVESWCKRSKVEDALRKRDDVAKALLPLRRMYHAATGRFDMTQAEAIESWVVRALRKPLTASEREE